MSWETVNFAASRPGRWQWITIGVLLVLIVAQQARLSASSSGSAGAAVVPHARSFVRTEVAEPRQSREQLARQVRALNPHLARLGLDWPSLMQAVTPGDGIRLKHLQVDSDRHLVLIEGEAISAQQLSAYQHALIGRSELQQVLLTRHQVQAGESLGFSLEALWRP